MKKICFCLAILFSKLIFSNDLSSFNIVFQKRNKVANFLKCAKKTWYSELIIEYKFNKNIKKVLKDLQDKDGFIEMDCQVFAQVAALMKQNKNKKFSIYKGRFSADLLKKKVTKNIEIGCIMPTDKHICNLLVACGSQIINKSMWISEESKDLWIGLTEQGIMYKSKDQWIQERKEDLQNECDYLMQQYLNQEARNQALIINAVINTGLFDEWFLSGS